MSVRHAIAKRRLLVAGPFREEIRFGINDRGVYLGADVLELEQLHGVVDPEAELNGWKDSVFSDSFLHNQISMNGTERVNILAM